jgi:protein gp37
MSSTTGIEWTDATWNPVTGCSPISPGCEHCYAARMAQRLAGRCGYPADEPFRPGTVHEDKMSEPTRWKTPRRVFVCSMGDLFHEDVPDHVRLDVLTVMAWTAPQHTYLLLTKRPAVMRRYFESITWAAVEGKRVMPVPFDKVDPAQLAEAPFPANIWLGVTAEDQKRADERLPILTSIPAMHHFVSCEPLLGPVDVTPWAEALDWVILGGETGPGARPMHPNWARAIVCEREDAGVPVFFKSWGEWAPGYVEHGNWLDYGDMCVADTHDWPEGWCSFKVGKKAAGHLLDCQEYQQVPLTMPGGRL